MSKKQKLKQSAPQVVSQPTDEVKEISFLERYQVALMALVLTAVCFVFYGNTYYNDYCLDDLMVINGNMFTKQGFDGIYDLFTKDFLYGFRGGESHDFASSRWRPLSMVSFAIEQGFFGGNPHISHLINILFYALTVLLIFYYLGKYIFKDYRLSFFIALLFAIHPIHTEVVANIKSRDEIFCFFFTLITLVSYALYFEGKKMGWLVVALFSYFLSLLSKENSITFLAAFPLLLYFFTELKPKQIATHTAWLLAVAVVFLVLRNAVAPFSHSTGSEEILNNPFLYADGGERWASIIYLLLWNLKLLILPYPLSYDYSFNQFPYRNFGDGMVWLSIGIFAVMGLFALWQLKRKSIWSFCILFFLITFSIGSNLVVEIGTPLAERILYIPSLALCIALVFLAKWALHFIKNKKASMVAIACCILPLLILCAKVTISRNKDWKNDQTLNIADNPKCPNSARLCNGTGGAYIVRSSDTSNSARERDSLLKKAIVILKHGLDIHPTYDDCALNVGVAYSRMNQVDSCEYYWNLVRKRAPSHPKFREYDKYLSSALLNEGLKYGNKKEYTKAVDCFERALTYDANNANILYNLGGCLYTSGRYAEAATALEKSLSINPNNEQAKQGLMASRGMMGQPMQPSKVGTAVIK